MRLLFSFFFSRVAGFLPTFWFRRLSIITTVVGFHLNQVAELCFLLIEQEAGRDIAVQRFLHFVAQDLLLLFALFLFDLSFGLLFDKLFEGL